MKQDNRQQRILKAAERLFEHYGPHKTTIADIAKEAHISVGSVYLEFSSKDNILFSLSENRHELILKAMSQASNQYELSFPERFCQILHARTSTFLSFAQKGTHSIDFFDCKCAGIENAHESFQKKEKQLLTEFLKQGIKQNEFTITNPTQTAAIILQTLTSFSPPFLFHQCPEKLSSTLDALFDLLLHGIQSK